eukprot:Hpha_TRINITY_DN16849_c2_g1::TRINITY_DN16849_c2_g1_i1::g.153624::m.153624
MSRGAPKVHQPPLREEDDVPPIRQCIPVDLGLDLNLLRCVGLEPFDLDLGIEVANVAHNGIVLHPHKMTVAHDVVIPGGRHENMALLHHIVKSIDLITLHQGLQCVDRIDLAHDHTRPEAAQCSTASLPHVPIPRHETRLTGHHNVGGALDAVDKGLPAPVQVIKFRLCYRVVDVDRRERQSPVTYTDVQLLPPCCCLLGQPHDPRVVLFPLRHHSITKLPPIIQQHVGHPVPAEALQRLLDAPHKLLLSLPLPGENGDACFCDGCGGLVLSREDVAAGPSYLCAESGKSLDQDRGLDGHVKASRDLRSSKGLRFTVFTAKLHKTRHFVLRKLNFLPPEFCERHVPHLEIHSAELPPRPSNLITIKYRN